MFWDIADPQVLIPTVLHARGAATQVTVSHVSKAAVNRRDVETFQHGAAKADLSTLTEFVKGVRLIRRHAVKAMTRQRASAIHVAMMTGLFVIRSTARGTLSRSAGVTKAHR